MIVVALLVVLLHIPVPDWAYGAAGWTFGLSAPTFLVSGMILCWRLPDRRRYWALIVNLFLIASGVGLMHYAVESERAGTQESILATVRASAEYHQAETNLADDRRLQQSLLDRLEATPADYVTVAKQLTAQIQDTGRKIADESIQLAKLEQSAPQIQTSGAIAFDALGKQWSSWLQAAVLIILAAGNEVIALALMGRSKSTPVVERPVSRGEPVSPRPTHFAPAQRAVDIQAPEAQSGSALGREVTAADYIRVAREHAKDGRPAGYRTVKDVLGISDRKAKQLLKEVQDEIERRKAALA
jgi:hypothetical protein